MKRCRIVDAISACNRASTRYYATKNSIDAQKVSSNAQGWMTLDQIRDMESMALRLLLSDPGVLAMSNGCAPPRCVVPECLCR